MLIGKKNRRAVFQRRTRTPDLYGDSAGTDTYSDLGEAWVSFQPLRGNERLQADQILAELTHRIRCRYSFLLSTLSPKDRIDMRQDTSPVTHDYYEIVSVIDIEGRRRELEIMAVKREG